MFDTKFTCRRRGAMYVVVAVAASILASGGAAQEESEEESAGKEESTEDVDFTKLKSPVPHTRKSIKRGKSTYIRMCADCHGPDGKALLDIVADATDLTNPKRWYSGTTEGEIFRSIRDGAGETMPPFKDQLRKEEDMWHMVNFIRSLWPKDVRPQIQEETEASVEVEKGPKPSPKGEKDND